MRYERGIYPSEFSDVYFVLVVVPQQGFLKRLCDVINLQSSIRQTEIRFANDFSHRSIATRRTTRLIGRIRQDNCRERQEKTPKDISYELRREVERLPAPLLDTNTID